MRRTVLLFLAATLALALAAGTAFAVNKMCPQNCRGTSEGDRLVGSARGNTIYALAGSDRVLGRGGDDALKGGDGRDEVFGQEDNDRVKGSFGRDRVYVGPGDDLVRGGTAQQTNDGARDVLDCGDGTQDTVYWTPGVDEIRDCEILNPPG
jgi:Ca2+-binding RTX toxin-like protein